MFFLQVQHLLSAYQQRVGGIWLIWFRLVRLRIRRRLNDCSLCCFFFHVSRFGLDVLLLLLLRLVRHGVSSVKQFRLDASNSKALKRRNWKWKPLEESLSTSEMNRCIQECVVHSSVLTAIPNSWGQGPLHRCLRIYEQSDSRGQGRIGQDRA